MHNVIVLSGPSGCGKSTLARALLARIEHHRWENNVDVSHRTRAVSADDHHTDAEGVYDFHPEEQGIAMNECYRAAVESLVSGRAQGFRTTVLVDNTNLSVAEIAPYMLLGSAYGVMGDVPVIVRIRTEEVETLTNGHGVPERVVGMMREWERDLVLPQWWDNVIEVKAHQAWDAFTLDRILGL